MLRRKWPGENLKESILGKGMSRTKPLRWEKACLGRTEQATATGHRTPRRQFRAITAEGHWQPKKVTLQLLMKMLTWGWS